jgi:two-component system, LytTR family, sensor kinase
MGILLRDIDALKTESAMYNYSMRENSIVEPVSINPLARPWLKYALIFGLWTLFAIFVAILGHARMVSIEQESSLVKWLLDAGIEWNLWAAFTIPIVWFARKFPIDRHSWSSNGLIHLGISTVLISIHTFIKVGASLIIFNEWKDMPFFVDRIYAQASWMGPWQILIYGCIVAGAMAIDYQKRLRDKELQSSRLEAQITRAQLENLQQQLQPHFLFNTLNSISVLVQKGDQQAATKMLSNLSDLLRYVLNHDQAREVALTDELEFVRRYVEIEQTRHGERLQIEFHVDPEALRARVPGFMLQLLVENAIRHGVAKKAGTGKVDINVARENGHLSMVVTDNGVGLSQDGAITLRNGVGISNARKRLELLYGENFVFELRNGEFGGAVARMEIPFEECI